MPGLKAHLIAGGIICAALAIVLRSHPQIPLTPWLVGVLGSAFPDVDHPRSKIRKAFWAAVILALAVSAISSEPALMIAVALAVVVVKLSRHRGFIHSLGSMVATGLAVWIWSDTAAIFWIAGYFSHLVLDGELKLV